MNGWAQIHHICVQNALLDVGCSDGFALHVMGNDQTSSCGWCGSAFNLLGLSQLLLERPNLCVGRIDSVSALLDSCQRLLQSLFGLNELDGAFVGVLGALRRLVLERTAAALYVLQPRLQLGFLQSQN